MKTKPNAQSLCVQCGLCCTGTILADVELEDEAEAIAMECLGLEVEEEEGRELLLQPCRALRGTRCGIYPHRPETCRRFDCRVLQEFVAGAISYEVAKRKVARLRHLLSGDDRGKAQRYIDRHFLGL